MLTLTSLAALAPKEERRSQGHNGNGNGRPIPGTGDYSTFDVVRLCQDKGIYGKPGNEPGKHHIRCWQEHLHSSGDGANDSDTVVWEAEGGGWPRVCCQHDHCRHLGIQDFIEHYGVEEVSRYCREQFRTTQVWKAGGGNGAKTAPAVERREANTILEEIRKCKGDDQAEARDRLLQELAETIAGDEFTVNRYAELLKKELGITKGVFTKAADKAARAQRAQTQTRVVRGHARHETPDRPAQPQINLSALVTLPEQSDAAWRALETANQRRMVYFRSARLASRMERDDDGKPIIQALDLERMRHELRRGADWWKDSEKTGLPYAIDPPADVAKDMLAAPDIPLPVLARIVEAPVFAADGTLQTTPGYHPRSRTYYHPAPGLVIPEVSEVPTPEEVRQAVSLYLDDLYVDFPMSGDAPESERAHALALALLPFARDLIDGQTPLHLIEKPKAGTGATLLADVAMLPALGRSPAALPEGDTEAEWRKRLTGCFIEASPVALLDNVKSLASTSLALALTAPEWTDRPMGSSQMVRCKPQCVWIATGNNPTLTDELKRRTVRIRIDAKVEQPHLRKDFKHPYLRLWAMDNRGRLIWAALTIIQAWIANGRPNFSGQLLGKLEEWSQVMGGILENAGVPGFLGNLQDFYGASDSDTEAWRCLVTQWWECFRTEEIEVGRDLLGLAAHQEPPLYMGKGDPQSQKISLGKQVRDRRDQRFTILFDPARATRLPRHMHGKPDPSDEPQESAWEGEDSEEQPSRLNPRIDSLEQITVRIVMCETKGHGRRYRLEKVKDSGAPKGAFNTSQKQESGEGGEGGLVRVTAEKKEVYPSGDLSLFSVSSMGGDTDSPSPLSVPSDSGIRCCACGQPMDGEPGTVHDHCAAAGDPREILWRWLESRQWVALKPLGGFEVGGSLEAWTTFFEQASAAQIGLYLANARD